MKEDKFNSLEELFQKLLPALRTKKNEMAREKMIFSEQQIWTYFCKYVWPKKNSLTLGEMVNDILNTDNFTIYVSKKGEGYGTDYSE